MLYELHFCFFAMHKTFLLPQTWWAVTSPIDSSTCVVACCSALQSGAVRCSVIQSCGHVTKESSSCVAVCCSALQCVAMCCCVAVTSPKNHHHILQCVAVRCSVRQCVALRGSVAVKSPTDSSLCAGLNHQQHVYFPLNKE